MVLKVTCYECIELKECPTCKQEWEVEGVTYNLDDFEHQDQVDSVLYGVCPVCESHRIEVE